MFKLNSPRLALFLIESYKSDWDNGNPNLTEKVGTFEHEYEYAIHQLQSKTKSGFGENVLNKRILEIGCGHGGICIYASMNGAKKVIGVDISDDAIKIAKLLKEDFENRGLLRSNNVVFEKASTEHLPFEDESFDLIIADNVFEHVADIEKTLNECKRVLIKGGMIYAPTFPSILSKAGPHLKYGTKIPWLHIFFTEKSICKALYNRAIKYPDLKLFEYYGGLKNKPDNYRDVREYKDLNYITNAKMKLAIKKSSLQLLKFHVHRPFKFELIFKVLPFLRKTKLDDILSTGSSFKAIKT